MNTGSRPRLITADDLVRQTVGRLLVTAGPPDVVRAAEAGQWPASLWNALSDGGFAALGGAPDQPAEIIEAMAVLHEAGRHATPLPVAEQGVLGGWLLAVAGCEPDAGVVAVPVPDRRDRIDVGGGDPRASDLGCSTAGGTGPLRLVARLHAVPWGGSAGRLLLAVPGGSHGSDGCGGELVISVRRPHLRIERSRNIAGEPRDIVHVDCVLDPADVHAVPAGTAEGLRLRGAFSRAAMMSGAMARCVDLAAGYARSRHQFGQPIIRFQSVAHLLATAAEQSVLAESAVQVAAEALADDAADPMRCVAAARAVLQRSARIVTANAHQVLGAIGVTQEYELQLYTRRIWAWEAEWGTAQDSARQYGRWLAGRGPDALWETLAGTAG
jgi:acyl-CoA dehydrogenase